MRMIGDDRNQLRFDRGIDLDLGVAVVGVPVDVADRLLGGIDPHLGRAGELPGAVNNAGFQNARAKLAAIIKARDALQKTVGVVRHVARAGHAVGQIERAIDVAKVLVVVPQPGHQEPAMRVDDLGVGRWLQVGVRDHPHDSIAAHQNTCPRSHAQVARIEEAGVTDDEVGFRRVGKFVRDPL